MVLLSLSSLSSRVGFIIRLHSNPTFFLYTLHIFYSFRFYINNNFKEKRQREKRGMKEGG